MESEGVLLMYQDMYERWLAAELDDADLKPELESVKGDDAAIQDRFAVALKFGTAGLRGVIGAGTNRMNIYVVRQATHELWNHTKFNKILRKCIFQQFADIFIIRSCQFRIKANGTSIHTIFNDSINAFKSTTTDKQNICGINRNQFLLRMLSATLWRNRRNSSFQNFQ